MSEVQLLVIVRYAQHAKDGVLTREGVENLNVLASRLRDHLDFPLQIYYLDFVGKPIVTPLSRTACVLSAYLGMDPRDVTPIHVNGNTLTERLGNLYLVLDFLQETKACILVVNSEFSASLAEFCTKGWPDDCVAILDPGRAHVLDLVNKTYYDL